jgi:hypothetical protein
MEVTFDINDPKDIEWLDTFPTDEQKIRIIQQCISIGRSIFQTTTLQLTQTDPLGERVRPIIDSVLAGMNETVADFTQTATDFHQTVQKNTEAVMETLRSTTGIAQQIVGPLTEKMTLIDDNINRLLSINSSSNVKGKLTEGIFGNMMERLFPDWEVKNMSNQAHESDYQIRTDFGETLVELKNYNHTVSTAQIQKFYRDIDETGIRFAVFLSVGSGIVGKRELSWEVYGSNRTVIIWLPNSTIEPVVLQTAFGLLRALQGILERSEEKDRSEKDIGHIDRETDRVLMEISETIRSGYERQNRLTGTIQTIKNSLYEHKVMMDKCVMDIATRLTELEIEYRSVVSETFNVINQQLQSICHDVEAVRNVNPFRDYSQWSEWVHGLSTSAQNKRMLEMFYTEVNGWNNFSILRNESGCVFIVRNTKRIADIAVAKTKVDIVIPYVIREDEFLIYHQYESYKDGCILFGLRGNMDGIHTLKRRLEKMI